MPQTTTDETVAKLRPLSPMLKLINVDRLTSSCYTCHQIMINHQIRIQAAEGKAILHPGTHWMPSRNPKDIGTGDGLTEAFFLTS